MIHETRDILCCLMISFLIISSALGSSEPPKGGLAHYLVLRLTADGDIRLETARKVRMAGIPVSDSEWELDKTRDALPDGVTGVVARVLDRSGQTLFVKQIRVEGRIRGEFHGADGSSIERVELYDPEPAFVLRLPAWTEGTLQIEAPSRPQLNLDLDNLPVTEPGPVTQAVQLRAAELADPANRVDFLVIGDGYTAAEESQFDTDTQELFEAFLDVEPYQQYAGFVNTASLFTPSPESGADHPPYDADCGNEDLTCCPDIAAQSDPREGTYVDTLYDARFCGFSTHRLLLADFGKVLTAAAAYPDWDVVLLMVNDPVYGGAGGGILTSSTNPAVLEVVRHEYGHTFTFLADEYSSPFPGFPACSDLAADSELLPRCEANVTNETDSGLIKWAPWIESGTPIPTPDSSPYDSDVGLFEGARYQDFGFYRPRRACKMQVLGVPFCEVCQQEYILQLYRGGWGVPAAGIDLIEPGSALPAPGDVSTSGPLEFSVDLLQPEQGVRVRWRVNGETQAGETGDRFMFSPASPGTYDVQVQVTDRTQAVHPDMLPSGLLTSQRKWTVTVADGGFAINAGLNDAWFNAATAGQGFFIIVFPDIGKIFLAMFSYDSERPDDSVSATFGAADQRWVTAFGDFAGNEAVLDAELTRGGVFDSGIPAIEQVPGYGTLTLVFSDCSNLSLTYEFPSLGLQGTIPLTRVANDNVALCESLSHH